LGEKVKETSEKKVKRKYNFSVPGEEKKQRTKEKFDEIVTKSRRRRKVLSKEKSFLSSAPLDIRRRLGKP
jgi:hypothetical protein